MKPTSVPYRRVSTRIRRLRAQQGLSQRDISCPGVTYAYISRIEGGTRRPSLEALIALGKRLGVTALYLMYGSDHAECPVCGRRPADP